jgi:hypothetical protein
MPPPPPPPPNWPHLRIKKRVSRAFDSRFFHDSSFSVARFFLLRTLSRILATQGACTSLDCTFLVHLILYTYLILGPNYMYYLRLPFTCKFVHILRLAHCHPPSPPSILRTPPFKQPVSAYQCVSAIATPPPSLSPPTQHLCSVVETKEKKKG